jgi:transcriptional regulator with XRE-family HTH domain
MEETFGELVKEARKKRSLSQKALGELTGHTQSTIADIENNHNKPNLVTIMVISKVLKINLNRLVK